MTQILVELYEALKSAGAPEDKAQAAAASVIGSSEKDALATKADLEGVEHRLELKIEQAKNETLRWFFAISLGLVGAIFSIVKFVH